MQFYSSPLRGDEQRAIQPEEGGADDGAVVSAADAAAAADATTTAPDDAAVLVDVASRTPSERSSVLRALADQLAADERRRRRNEAATRIQRCFLRWRIRRLARRTRFERYVRIGMADRRRWDFRERDAMDEARRRNALKKAAYDEAFRLAVEDTRARIVQFRAPWIVEDISDHIRAWFLEMWLASEEKEFDVYPPAAKGGTILVLRGETASPWEFVEQLKRREELAAMKPEQRKKIADDEKKKKAAEKKALLDEKRKRAQAKADKKALQAKTGKQWEFNEEEFITKPFLGLDAQMVEYDREWQFVDEFANPTQAPMADWIDVEEYAKVHLELRVVVDELMRVEYELLQQARCLDQKQKYRPPKPPKEKKGKKGKKKQAKAAAPLFGERDEEDVYDEMVRHGVIQTHVPRRRFDEYIGDRNYCAFEMRNYYDT